jgi:hypothetical protein
MSGETNARKYSSNRRQYAGLARTWRALSGSRRRAGLLSAVAVAAAVALVPTAGAVAGGTPQAPRAGAVPAHGASKTPGPFVTLLFSRTEISAADNCVEDDDDIARLDTVVAPYLQSLGMAGTGTLVTGRTQDTTRFCTHYNDDLTASWADATNLAQNYGWSFVSHTETYPGLQAIQNMNPKEAYNQTCGTIATIKSHGLPGAAGMIAYPGSYTKNPAVVNLQKTYGQNCFDWGRQYDHAMHGLNDPATASATPPYWVYPVAVVGGPCNDPTQPCYHVHISNGRYTMPSTIINRIEKLKPGQWYILQAYVLVTGTNPEYASNRNRWDCTSSNPAEHWTNVTVRYCWSDYQQIIQAIAADPNITVTDPLTVGKIYGRPYS